MASFNLYTKFAILVIVLMALSLIFVYIKMVSGNPSVSVTSFAECAAAGYPVRESYPAQCSTPDGRLFTQEVTGQDITISGKSVCLPHKQTDGPQTLECAFGLQDTDGNYYALRDLSSQFVTQISAMKEMTITGRLTTDPESKYDIVGVIEVTSVNN